MAASIFFKIIVSIYITSQHVSAINTFKPNGIQPLIFYGDAARIKDYPFYAGLNNCGAAILSDVWILTAAHCVEHVDLRQRNYVWVGGETFANSKQVPYNYVHIHPEYRDHPLIHPINDIALIKLSTPLIFSKKIQPIQLPKGPISNPKVTFVGRGTDETGHASKTLKKVDLINLSIMECLQLIPPQYHAYVQKNKKALQITNICTKREGNRPSICNGDSGSPLISGDSVVGLASFIGGLGCKNAKLGFFVNVSSYVPWIKSVTGIK